jgi:hypothetical protein
LRKLGYHKPNLSAIERQNGTARRMNAYYGIRLKSFRSIMPPGATSGSW